MRERLADLEPVAVAEEGQVAPLEEQRGRSSRAVDLSPQTGQVFISSRDLGGVHSNPVPWSAVWTDRRAHTR